ncbi:MAG TPA: ABC transporter permease, partial [Gemmatimonadaceae bacterium]|nr:ABC transporter permease [Gemmatimonadaceae bacterium]
MDFLILLVGFLAQAIRIAIPYLFASAGGVASERAGLIGLTLEGYMLGGAFCAAVASYYTGSAWLGVLAGMGGGVLLALLYGMGTIRYRANQVVIGIAINLLAIGLTRFFLRLAFDSSSNSPRVPGFMAERSGTGFGALATNPLVWLGIVALPVLAWLLYRTPFGLRLRATGEHPEAAASLGIRVAAIRWKALALSGLFAGLGGVYLAMDQHQFTDGMTAGRGFIALAATIFGRWEPKRVAL